MGSRLVSYIRHHHLALLALFVALGGTSYAAVSLPANSVGSKQVIDRSLLGRDFKAGQLPKGARGAQGARGPTGARGQTGATGTPDPSNFYTKAQGDARFVGGGGGATIDSGRLTKPNNDLNADFTPLVTVAGLGVLGASCYPAPRISFTNTSGTALTAVYDLAGSAAGSMGIAAGGFAQLTTTGPTGRVLVQIAKTDVAAGKQVATIVLTQLLTGGFCHYAAQSVVQNGANDNFP